MTIQQHQLKLTLAESRYLGNSGAKKTGNIISVRAALGLRLVNISVKREKYADHVFEWMGRKTV